MPRMYLRGTLRERFDARVDRASTPDGCWPWIGGASNGYGSMWTGDEIAHTHRVALELALGRPIRPGFYACHHCNNRRCCRVGPKHIYEGTPTDNAREMYEHGRGRGGTAKVPFDEIPRIKQRYRLGESMGTIAKDYGCSRQTIGD